MISVLIIFMGITIIGVIFFWKVKFLVQSSNNSEKKIPDNQAVSEAITKVEDNKNNSSGKLNRSNRKTIDNPDLEAL